MTKAFLIDFNRCNGCRNCQIACKDEHCEQAWLPYAEAQPIIGHYWMNVKEKTRGQVPVVKVSYQPTLCTHCQDAPCVAAGKGAVYQREDGLVIIDPGKAVGLRELVDACPLGAIYYNEELSLPQKCTGCAHLLDDGWSVPRCVDACATEALLYLDVAEIDLSKAETLEQTAAFGPRVYYLNRPRRFIAGLVFDGTINEVLIGARVELLDGEGRVLSSVRTDDFGDFRFNQIEPAVYQLTVFSDLGTRTFNVDTREQDRYVGDIDMTQSG
ncbi:MAG: (4Fe-4S)-binding protein [Coriobacteriales bacterium]|jgi:Fe-S-cluster-containing dehydrogenase component|nr:(4Fe-4S)-binding protein [Coriobacteriales bacterium]